MQPTRILSSTLTVLVSSLFLTACTENGSLLSPSSRQAISLADITTAASVDAVDGILRAQAGPSPSGGPVITVTGNPTVVNGGTMAIAVSSLTPFQTIYVQVAGKTLGLISEIAGGIGGHYEIPLGSPATSVTVLLAFPQSIPLREFELQLAVADPAGAVGPYVALPTTVTQVGTGDIQVTLSWDADSDVDLHIVEPSGEEVFWGHRNSATGGELDLDSNAACEIDGVRNENITWPVGRAPQGTYTVRVNYWSSCGVGRTNYTVRVNVGGDAQIFTGFFTGSGNQGAEGAGVVVTTFQRLTGPAATALGADRLFNALGGLDKRRGVRR